MNPINDRSSRILHVLVVDDNNLNRQLVKKMIEKLGHTADTAESGLAAIDQAAANRYDIIFMDVSMPGISGTEAARTIKSRLMHTPPIVAITANALEGDRESLLEEGMDDYLSKPFTLADLRFKIEHWLPGAE